MVTYGRVWNRGEIIKTLLLAIAPTAQMRPRFQRFTGVTYKDKKQVCAERDLDKYLRAFAPKSPITAPVSVEIEALVPIPISAAKRRREAMSALDELPCKKPDLDNYIKQILDAMTRCEYWSDDNLVCEIISRKYYALNPGWFIVLRECDFHV